MTGNGKFYLLARWHHMKEPQADVCGLASPSVAPHEEGLGSLSPAPQEEGLGLASPSFEPQEEPQEESAILIVPEAR